MSSEDPGLRIGHTERDEAVRLLKQQAEEGRLGSAELADRTDQVRRARTREDMMPAFADLPVDVPAAEQDAFPLYPGTDPVTGAATPTAGQEVAVPPEATQSAVPGGEPDRIETSATTKRIGAAVIALMWPAVIVLNFVFGWHLWWLFLIPVFASGWIAYAFGLGDRPDQQRHQGHDGRHHGRQRGSHGD